MLTLAKAKYVILLWKWPKGPSGFSLPFIFSAVDQLGSSEIISEIFPDYRGERVLCKIVCRWCNFWCPFIIQMKCVKIRAWVPETKPIGSGSLSLMCSHRYKLYVGLYIFPCVEYHLAAVIYTSTTLWKGNTTGSTNSTSCRARLLLSRTLINIHTHDEGRSSLLVADWSLSIQVERVRFLLWSNAGLKLDSEAVPQRTRDKYCTAFGNRIRFSLELATSD